MEETTVIFAGGQIEYSLEAASVDIDELIEALTEAKEEGATSVAFSSGNYRGARWAKPSTHWSWAGEYL